MSTAIKVDGVSKEYRLGELHRHATFRETLLYIARTALRRKQEIPSIWALKDVTLNINEGEVVGIIGRNGSGKSTLLKVLSKITYPTEGKLKVRGRVASLLEVGTGFHSELTGRENIYLNGSIMGMRKREIESKLDAIVAFAGVERFLDTPIKRYSSGMHLRLGFAVAAHLEPDVLLVDEVLAVGDVEFQKRCLKAMDDLHGGGRTVLFVSHNMAAIENHCPRCVWIDNGAVRMDGQTTDVIKAYMKTFASAKQASFDLRGIQNRRGTGEIRYTGINFLDTERQVSNLIRSGDSFVIRLMYDANGRVVNPHFGVIIYTDLGTQVATLSTWGAGFDIPRIDPGEGYIDLDVGFLNLMPGRYHISLWLAGVGPKFDHLEHCATFDVEPSNIYGSGRMDKGALIFLPCKWNQPVGTSNCGAALRNNSTA